ncbi:MAG: ATP-binding protein [Verrucomicrobiota bacterium]
MQYLPRLVEERLRLYRNTFPCVLIAGARQVGKSTLLQQLFGNEFRTFVFDPVQDLYQVRRDPDLFLRNNPPPLILDEIQYVPELVPAIKRYVDLERRPGQFLITGSQQWHVIQRLSESLAGRVAPLDLSGFCLAETRAGHTWFDTWLTMARKPAADALPLLRKRRSAGLSATETIWRGSFPEVQTLPEAAVPGWMQGYVATYLQRDVRLILEARDEMQLAAFLSLCATLTAQECNYSKLGKDIGLSSPMAKKWLSVMRQTYQWTELPAFSRNPVKRLSLRPKGYFVDTGLACHLMRISSPQAVQGHPVFGALFETLVMQECLKQAQSLPVTPAWHHYRQHSGAEVDLIAELDGWLFPVEIKASSSVGPGDAIGMDTFRQFAPGRVGLGLVIYAGKEVLQISEQCLAVPFDLM